MSIHNIVFDIGNVIVRWDPALIVARAFGPERGTSAYAMELFGSPIWKAINRGEMSEALAKKAYVRDHGLSADEADTFFLQTKESLDLLPGTCALMAALASDGYRIFALSDNVHEIVAHLKQRYDFWRHFEGAVISAEIGLLKPSPEIFQYLLDTHGLTASETLFFDDVATNVAGAQSVGLHALQFSTCEQAIADMGELGVRVREDWRD